MSGTIIKNIGRFFIVYGLIVTVLTISGILQIKQFTDIQQFSQAIFNTNCIHFIKLTQTCTNIFTLILALLIVSAILIAIFYKTFSMIFASISLVIFTAFYCNPKIDLSFQNFIHFIQICTAVCGLLFIAFRQKVQKS